MDTRANAPSEGTRRQRLPWRWYRLKNAAHHWFLTDGDGHAPNHWRMSAEHVGRWASQGKRYRAVFLDDSGSIGIAVKDPDGGNERWDTIIPAHVFRRLALWYVWRWAWGEWCGLRRWLFYRDLTRRMDRFRAQQERVVPALVGRAFPEVSVKANDEGLHTWTFTPRAEGQG